MSIPRRVAQALINSLKGGVTPRVGLPYVTVGRKEEIEALLRDVDIIAEGGASFRFIAGKYGSGKSFLLQTLRNYVLARNFVAMDADLSPERRLRGTKGEGLATYRELVANMATKTRPEGGALSLILDRWINNVRQETAEEANLSPADPALGALVEKKIMAKIASLKDMVHGFEFARLLATYYRAYATGDDDTTVKVLKWFRGEYANRAEARKELGVNIVINDDDWYDYLKLFAHFFKQAGYSGTLVLIDELVNVYKIPNSITRQYNYEKILTTYNDAMQGRASYLGIILCVTPQALEDPRRGVYSYEALRSRLAEGRFGGEHKDLLSPVIRLQPLTKEETLALVEKLADIHADLYQYKRVIGLEDLATFLEIEYDRVGADEYITPREIIRDFIEALDILYQNPKLTIAELLGSEDFKFAKNSIEEEAADDRFAEFDI